MAAAWDRSGAVLHGEFPVLMDGTVIDVYSVRIEVSTRFPRGLPTIYEVSGRIPRDPDRHVNGDGSCCVGVPVELELELGPSFSILDYLRGPVNSFFVGQYLVERGLPWPSGVERSHGAEGVLEFFREHLGEPELTLKELVRWIALFAQKSVKRHYRCPCGTGRVIRSCHPERFAAMVATVSRHRAQEMLLHLGGARGE